MTKGPGSSCSLRETGDREKPGETPRSQRPGSRLPQGYETMIHPADDDLLPEFDLSYIRSQPNRFADRTEEPVPLADPQDERQPQGKSVDFPR